MLDASGEISVTELISTSKLHFFADEKFCGLAGSSCPSQPTMPLERSVSGKRGWSGVDEGASVSCGGFSGSCILLARIAID